MNPSPSNPIFKTRGARRWAANGILVAAAALAVFGLRHSSWVETSPAPEYRQKGPKDAPVTIVEFSDFQCGGCRDSQPVLHAIEAQFAGQVRIIFKHMPLTRHKWAGIAARAAECAGEQGKFWEFHDRLYDRQKEWENLTDANPSFSAIARELSLDESAFDTCKGSEDIAIPIRRDAFDAVANKVKSTPTFFIGDKRFVGKDQLATEGMREIMRRLGRE